MNRVGIFTQEEIIEKCKENPRIKDGGSEFVGSRLSENECPFKLHQRLLRNSLNKSV